MLARGSESQGLITDVALAAGVEGQYFGFIDHPSTISKVISQWNSIVFVPTSHESVLQISKGTEIIRCQENTKLAQWES